MVQQGHLFVVRGRVDALQREAAVVGVDAECAVDVADRPLFPGGPPSPPRTWPEGWGRNGRSDVWMVQTAEGSADEVLTHLRRALADIATAALAPGHGRERPLICLPLLGLPREAEVRPHQWLSDLLQTLRDSASEHGHDITLVTQDGGEYAAAQWLRRGWESHLDEASERVARELGERARTGSLAFFLGSGWGRGAGVPSRAEIIDRLLEETDGTRGRDHAGLSLDERAQLVALHDNDGTRRRLARAVAEVASPGLVHALVASLAPRAVVTTSQDRLLSDAWASTVGVPLEKLSASRRVEGAPWIAALRGDVDSPTSLTLTASPAPGPVASLMRGLTLTHHWVVLGSRLDEPELIGALRQPGDPFPAQRCGTLLDSDVDGSQSRAALWGDRLARVRLGEGVTPERGLELFLDRVGVHATDPATWLLDERFAGLLAPRDQVYATQLRSVLGLLPQGSSTWAPLTEHVQQLGW